jgi:hypothetical protein
MAYASDVERLRDGAVDGPDLRFRVPAGSTDTVCVTGTPDGSSASCPGAARSPRMHSTSSCSPRAAANRRCCITYAHE